jgi:hypothetical protein
MFIDGENVVSSPSMNMLLYEVYLLPMIMRQCVEPLPLKRGYCYDLYLRSHGTEADFDYVITYSTIMRLWLDQIRI